MIRIRRLSGADRVRESESMPGLLLLVLFGFVLLTASHCGFEILDALAEPFPELRYFIRTENDYYDEKNYDQFLHTQTKHKYLL